MFAVVLMMFLVAAAVVIILQLRARRFSLPARLLMFVALALIGLFLLILLASMRDRDREALAGFVVAVAVVASVGYLIYWLLRRVFRVAIVGAAPGSCPPI